MEPQSRVAHVFLITLVIYRTPHNPLEESICGRCMLVNNCHYKHQTAMIGRNYFLLYLLKAVKDKMQTHFEDHFKLANLVINV